LPLKNYDLSVIIVSHNVRDLTRQCLASIYENTSQSALEVFVIDNASSDGSPEMVEQDFPQVRLIRNKIGRGLAVADNQGLELSTGRYVCTLNSDTVVLDGAFDRLVRFMDEHPDAGGATPRLVLPDGTAHPPFCGQVPTFKAELLEALSPLRREFAEALRFARFGMDIDYEETQEVPCILWGTAFMIRREVLEEIGPQDTRFFIYCEDVDWAIRIRKAGWKLYYVADAKVVHYGGQSTRQESAKMLAQKYRSKCRLIRKHYGFPAALMLRTAIAWVAGIRMAKWLAIYAARGGKRAEARARIDQMWMLIRAALAC